jgi:hypothetical protein
MKDRHAFRALTQTGPLLVRTRDGYCFRQEHAKELLAARGLKDLRRGALRRLMTDDDGCLRPELTEVAEQLIRWRPEDQAHILAWKNAKPPPWPPAEAITKLQQVEELAPGGWAGRASGSLFFG